MIRVPAIGLLLFLLPASLYGFVGLTTRTKVSSVPNAKLSAALLTNDELTSTKQQLLELIGASKDSSKVVDNVLADVITKEPLSVSVETTFTYGTQISPRRYVFQSSNATYTGSFESYIDLLQPLEMKNNENENTSTMTALLSRNVLPFIPPPLRSALATAGLPMGQEYVPMRDLFTSPAVSFAYERGWRQGFNRAGFPGVDAEASMAMEYFAVPMATSSHKVIVDMSCATGLFTRKFAKSGKYDRVLGCDYSPSMLEEARRRIQADPDLKDRRRDEIQLIRLDVGNIPMQSNSVDALHAGAAMHCWPDLNAAVKEIYRVLKPGGRYFATTFLSSYFARLQSAEGGATGPSRQAFQYFQSVHQLRNLMVTAGGFDQDKVQIEVLGNACVVIRCEK